MFCSVDVRSRLGPRTPAQRAPRHDALLPLDDRSRIAFALYPIHDDVPKLSAHLYLLREDDEPRVTLEVERDDATAEVATADVRPIGRTARFGARSPPPPARARVRVRSRSSSGRRG